MSEALGGLQEELVFGSGDFLRLLLNEQYDVFNDLSPREQALAAGYANGCPVTRSLTDPENLDLSRGPEKMLDRYGEVSFWFRHIVHTAESLNPELAAQLQEPVRRREPIGENFEQESVPPSFYTEMSPLGTLWGYAASRLIVRQLGSDRLPQYESQRRLDTGLTILDRAISEARSREDLLALVADEVVRAGDVDPLDVLHDTLSLGWVGEHHASSMVDNVKDSLKFKAPRVWEFYESLTEEQKLEAGIIVACPKLEAAAGTVSIEGLEAYHDEEFGYTLWENVIDPANPEGPRGIVMHVPSGSMSKVWELLEEGYTESIEILRGSGSLVFKREGSEDWVTAPLDSEHLTADDVQIGEGDMFCVVSDDEGIVVFSRPSKEFNISFERGVTQNPGDDLSRHVLARVALSGAGGS